MKMSHALLCLFCLAALTLIPARGAESEPAVAPSSVIVHSKFGGQIFGFDIDPNGNEGILSESTSLPGGRYLAAVETFDQTTGNIIKVVGSTRTQGFRHSGSLQLRRPCRIRTCSQFPPCGPQISYFGSARRE
jgi:hypothetical protein